jgi:AraC-like DNA-binding protein
MKVLPADRLARRLRRAGRYWPEVGSYLSTVKEVCLDETNASAVSLQLTKSRFLPRELAPEYHSTLWRGRGGNEARRVGVRVEFGGENLGRLDLVGDDSTHHDRVRPTLESAARFLARHLARRRLLDDTLLRYGPMWSLRMLETVLDPLEGAQLPPTWRVVLVEGGDARSRQLGAWLLHCLLLGAHQPFVELEANDLAKAGGLERALENARGGSLRLAAVDQLPLECQAELASLLANLEATSPSRVIATSGADLFQLTLEGRFAPALLDALSRWAVQVPEIPRPPRPRLELQWRAVSKAGRGARTSLDLTLGYGAPRLLARRALEHDPLLFVDLHQGIERAVHYLLQRFPERVLLDDVARHAYLTPSYLSRLFHREMGCTLHDFLVGVRVEQAVRLFENQPELSVTQACSRAGFGGLSAFERAFRRFLGCSPRVYRELHLPARMPT